MDAEVGVSAEGDVGLGAGTGEVVNPDGAGALTERRHACRHCQGPAATVLLMILIVIMLTTRATTRRRRRRIIVTKPR